MEILHLLRALLLFLAILAGALPLSLFFTLGLTRGTANDGFASRLMVLAFFWCLLEILTGIILGVAGLFNLTAVTLTELLLFFAGSFLLYENGLRLHPKKFTIPGLKGKKKFPILFILIASASLLLKLSLYPAGDSDTLAFHLPAIVSWYQSGSLWGHLQIPYPYNWEVLCSLFILPFGSDMFAAMPNLISWAILGLSVYLILREAGAGKFICISSSILLLSIPEILNTVNTFHIDLAFAAFFMAGVYFVYLHYKTSNVNCVLMTFFSIIMILGIKASGLPYGFLLFVLLLAVIIINLVTKKYGSVSFSIPVLALFIVSSPFIGFFWYFKNLIDTGNPLAFVKISLFGKTVFPGSVSAGDLSYLTLIHLFNWGNPLHWKIIGIEIIKRLQLPFLAIAVLSLGSIVLLFFNRAGRFQRGSILFFSALSLAAVFLYWNTPFSADNPLTQWIGFAFRYAFPFMSALCVLSGIALFRLKIKKPVIISLTALCVLAGLFNIIIVDTIRYNRNLVFSSDINSLTALLNKNPGMFLPIFVNLAVITVPYAAISGLAIALWAVFCYDNPIIRYLKDISEGKRYIPFLSGIVLLVIFLAIPVYFIQKERDVHRFAFYGSIPQYIDEHIRTNESVGFLFCDIYYPLYGKRLNIPVYPLIPDPADYAKWIEFLKNKNIRYIEVGPIQGDRTAVLSRIKSKTIGFLEDKNGPFARVAGDDLRQAVIPEKPVITETDYFSRPDRGRVLYRLK